MKSLRRSLGDKKDSHNSSSSSHASSPSASSPTFGQTPSLSKPTASIAPPKKVIKARENHTSSSPQELPFVKGEFFFVVGEKADPRGGPGYYEALSECSAPHSPPLLDES
jgi:bud emergence protein 1